MNIKMIITYDGTHYFGWQKTKTGPSIQEELEKALFQILGRPVSVEAASRTDRGVHAKGQVVNFFLTETPSFSRLLYSLNSVLPYDIRILCLEPAADDFHPTLKAHSKEYHYSICNQPIEDPIGRFYSWHIHDPLDLEAMRDCAKILMGTHDFASFTTIESKDTIRTLFSIQIVAVTNGQIEIQIVGDRFLYKMMRRLVGTLVTVGKKKFSKKDVLTLLKKSNRAKAGITAPAHGLFLYQVHFTNIRASL
jgi:tRNA pseudouridine38-40 synthase